MKKAKAKKLAGVKPSSLAASERMAKVRQSGTDIELALRKALFRAGLRYHVARSILQKPRRVADIVFPRLRVAIFVDGCFWHGCPRHATWPKRNADFWRDKIETNRRRDADTDRRLHEAGWTVIRVWEHEEPETAASLICSVIEKKKKES